MKQRRCRQYGLIRTAPTFQAAGTTSAIPFLSPQINRARFATSSTVAIRPRIHQCEARTRRMALSAGMLHDLLDRLVHHLGLGVARANRVGGDAGAVKLARDRPRETDDAVFARAVGGDVGAPYRPAMLAMLRMRPHFAITMSCAASRLHRNVPVRFVATMRSNSASDVRASGAESAMPELLTRISTGPLTLRQAANAARTRLRR